MRKLVLPICIGAALLLGGQASAADGKMLMIKHGCIACHKVEGKMVGPAYKDIAARYKDAEDAPALLADSVVNGGVNKWGTIPMPPNGGRPNIASSDVDALVGWILSL